MTRRIAIVGQGVMGLTSGVTLAEKGFEVTLIAREPFEDTTSMVAGAYWWPHRIAPVDRVRRWAMQTYEAYANMSQEVLSGVSFEKHLRLCVDPDDSAYILQDVENWERIDGKTFGVECGAAFLVSLPVVHVPVFMNALERRISELGATFVCKELESPSELAAQFDLVVNCTGVGSREFVGDSDVFPIRGQVVRCARPEGLRRSTRIYQREDQLTLVLPRPNDVILGGTAQVGDWDRSVRDTESEAILKRCAAVVPEIRGAEVLGAAVGLRPGRHEVRLELDPRGYCVPVLHNYGHGGGGYTVAWGCANEVAELAEDFFANRRR